MKRAATAKSYPEDPIAEIRQIRDEIAAEYGYSLEAIGRAAMRRQKSSGRKVVDLSKRNKRQQAALPPTG